MIDNKLVIDKKNDSHYLIKLFIDYTQDLSDTDEDFDRSVYSSKSDKEILSQLASAELDGELKSSSADAVGPDNELIYSTELTYGFPKENKKTCLYNPQGKGKIVKWPILLSAEKGEAVWDVELFVYYRDPVGNIHKLHPTPSSVSVFLPRVIDEYGRLDVSISYENGRVMPCGRYYAVLRLRKEDGSFISQPVMNIINIVPAKTSLENISSDLVGLDEVYLQMKALAKQKIFNENRQAMNLAPMPINLNAAVIGEKGTGKTSFAHVLYDFYVQNGFITNGDLHIVDAAKWGGHMPDETGNMSYDFSSAKNGMLYIENAGAMIAAYDMRGNKEAIVQTLVHNMRTGEDQVSVVLADTPEKISQLLATAGLGSLIGQIYHLPTLNMQQIMEVAERECKARGFVLTPEARNAMEMALSVQPDASTNDVIRLIDTTIANMSVRVVNSAQDTLFQDPVILSEIKAEDVPQIQIGHYDQSVSKLNKLVGLKNLKYSIESHLNLVRFAQLRSRSGLQAAMPPMHMIFTGNPGTGKTTVANLLGEIYASLGILKTGKVIMADRKKLVGQYIGDTEENTKRILQQAHGNILFIDEAYTLVGAPDDKKDFGPKVLDCLLEELSKENTDMIIIMAGYPDEMETMLQANKGLRSRFPYTFHFEDYSEDELIEIAVRTAQQSGYAFSEQALIRLRALIRKEMKRTAGREQKHFGNARFITRLISAQIIPNMSRRVLSSGSQEASAQFLSCIEAVDIPSSATSDGYAIDETLVAHALKQLDGLIGLDDVKQTLHNLVSLARSRQQNGEDLMETIPLQWTFTGSTGTGKSSVAHVLAQLLHAFHIISSDRMTQLRLPVPQGGSWVSYELDSIMRNAMKQSGQGLLFIDLDDVANSHMDIQWLRCKLTSLTAEMPGSYAFVIAVEDKKSARQPIDMPISTSVIHFPDYTEQELMSILKEQLGAQDYQLSAEAETELTTHIRSLCDNRDCGFANARTIQHICTAVTSVAELRITQHHTPDTPKQITKADVQSFRWNPIQTNRVGFGS